MMQTRRIPLSRKPLIPKPEETDGSKQILECVQNRQVAELALRIRDQSGASKTVALPARIGRFVLEAISEIATGNAVWLLPIRQELTTHEAADLLNVSRTHLIGILEKGLISYRLVGSHRRITLAGLLAYKEKTDAQRKKGLDALAAEAQELKLYE